MGERLTTDTGTLSDGTHIFFSTADDHPTARVIALASPDIDVTPVAGDLPTFELVPQNPDGVLLQSIHLVNDSTLILVYLRDACASVVFADARTGLPIGATTPSGTRGHVHTVDTLDIPVPPAELNHATEHTPTASAIPKHASISAISSRSDSPSFFFTVDTFVTSPYVLEGRLDLRSGAPEITLNRLGHESAPVEDLVCDQVFYESHDGVNVPLFICHRADLDPSKPHKTLLYAYGGSGICMTPTHEPLFEAFMRDLNGV
jgi:prolyl oligopeptidase